MDAHWAGAGESWPAESHSSCWGSQAGCDQEGHGLSRMKILGCPGIPQSEPDSGNSSYSCRSKEFSKCTAQKAVLVTCWGFLLSCHHLLSRQRMQRKRQDVFSCFCLVLCESEMGWWLLLVPIWELQEVVRSVGLRRKKNLASPK